MDAVTYDFWDGRECPALKVAVHTPSPPATSSRKQYFVILVFSVSYISTQEKTRPCGQVAGRITLQVRSRRLCYGRHTAQMHVSKRNVLLPIEQRNAMLPFAKVIPDGAHYWPAYWR